MHKILEWEDANEEAFFVAQNETVRINHPVVSDVVPDSWSTLFREEEHTRNSATFVAKSDTLIVALRRDNQIVNVLHARTARSGAGDPAFWGDHNPQEKPFGFFRLALRRELNVRPDTQARHGLRYALVYKDETLVPAYSKSGTTGWLLDREYIRDIRKAVPPLERGKSVEVYVRLYGRNPERFPNDGLIFPKRDFSLDGNFPETWDKTRDQRAMVVSIFKVELDLGTGEVKSILNAKGESVQSMQVYVPRGGGSHFHKEVGARLPAHALKEVRKIFA